MARPDLVFIVPGSLETRTGGYGYDRRIVAGLCARGWRVDVRELDAGFPFPAPPALDAAARELAGLPDHATVVVDGLAFGAMPDVVRQHAGRLRFVALVHHPLADETGLPPDVAPRLGASEREALTAARLVVVTSPRTAERLADYDVPPGRIAVVEPGTDPAPLARGSGAGEVAMLSVATLTPRKGHHVLLAALARLQHLQWRLTCVGSLERDAEHVARLRTQMASDGTGARITLAGETDEAGLEPLYDRADLFVLPTLYEGYGMVVAEALARGLPVVSTPTGAIPALVTGGAGVLVPAGDVEALRAALERVLSDPAARAAMTEAARHVRGRLPTWEVASARMADAIEGMRGDGQL